LEKAVVGWPNYTKMRVRIQHSAEGVVEVCSGARENRKNLAIEQIDHQVAGIVTSEGKDTERPCAVHLELLTSMLLGVLAYFKLQDPAPRRNSVKVYHASAPHRKVNIFFEEAAVEVLIGVATLEIGQRMDYVIAQ
jgi:hypothetical protein